MPKSRCLNAARLSDGLKHPFGRCAGAEDEPFTTRAAYGATRGLISNEVKQKPHGVEAVFAWQLGAAPVWIQWINNLEAALKGRRAAINRMQTERAFGIVSCTQVKREHRRQYGDSVGNKGRLEPPYRLSFQSVLLPTLANFCQKKLCVFPEVAHRSQKLKLSAPVLAHQVPPGVLGGHEKTFPIGHLFFLACKKLAQTAFEAIQPPHEALVARGGRFLRTLNRYREG